MQSFQVNKSVVLVSMFSILLGASQILHANNEIDRGYKFESEEDIARRVIRVAKSQIPLNERKAAEIRESQLDEEEKARKLEGLAWANRVLSARQKQAEKTLQRWGI